ncbi:MAG TPA: hypothetical protein VGH14_09795 [Solirubrobacterales bacterium]
MLGLNACNRLYETPNSTELPFFYYSHTSPVAPGDNCPTNVGSAISGQAFYEGSTYPSEYDNALFFADSVRGCIYVMPANETGEPEPLAVKPFLSSGGSGYPGVDIEQGPEGSIYYTDLYEGTVNRIAYDPGAVTARLTTVGDPWGEAPLKVKFDASESTGPPGAMLAYEWDFHNSGKFDEGSDSPTEEFTYTDGTKNVEAAVRVKDLETSNSSVAKIKIYPGDSPPKVTISEPSPSLTWEVGQQIKFAGSAVANGGAGGPLPPGDLNWTTRLLHCPFEASSCHEHPLQIFPGTDEGTIGAPDHDFPSYIHFFLTATDSRGLSEEASVKVEARPVSLQLRSEPPGIELVAGPKKLTTPAELQAIENSPTTVAAPETAVVGGVKYTFEKWSDGGARVHAVPTDASGTYTAIYRGPEAPGGSFGSGPLVGPPPPSKPSPPELKQRPAKKTRSTTAKFVFGGPAGTTFRCKLDGGKFVACRSPRVYRRLKPGAHTVRIYATNAGGERGAARVYRWKVVS